MLHPRVKGTHYEMGHHYGSLLRRNGIVIPEQVKERVDFGQRSEDEVSRIFPEVLDEIRGLAEGCQIPYEQVASFILGIGAFPAEPFACSIFAASTNVDVIFGRNHDFYYRFKNCTEAYLTCPDDAYSSIGHSDVFVGRADGVNNQGLAVGITAVEELAVRPGMNFALAVRYVLERCANTKEGVKALSNMRHSAASSFLLADSSGDLTVVEAAPEWVRTRRPEKEENFLLCTNHFLHPEMLEVENQKERCWDSEVRYRSIYESLKSKNGEITLDDAQKILSSHEGYVCFHDKEKGIGTLWSVVAGLKQPRVLRAEGHPCRTGYREDPRLIRVMQSS